MYEMTGLKIDRDAFYRTTDIAKAMEKQIGTVRGWCKDGKIPGVKKVGREFIIPGWGFIEFLSVNKKSGLKD